MRRADDKSDECWGSIKAPLNHGSYATGSVHSAKAQAARAMMQSGQWVGWRALAAGRQNRRSGVMTEPRHVGVSGLLQGSAD